MLGGGWVEACGKCYIVIFESLKENMAESLQILGLGRCAFVQKLLVIEECKKTQKSIMSLWFV